MDSRRRLQTPPAWRCVRLGFGLRLRLRLRSRLGLRLRLRFGRDLPNPGAEDIPAAGCFMFLFFGGGSKKTKGETSWSSLKWWFNLPGTPTLSIPIKLKHRLRTCSASYKHLTFQPLVPVQPPFQVADQFDPSCQMNPNKAL